MSWLCGPECQKAKRELLLDIEMNNPQKLRQALNRLRAPIREFVTKTLAFQGSTGAPSIQVRVRKNPGTNPLVSNQSYDSEYSVPIDQALPIEVEEAFLYELRDAQPHTAAAAAELVKQLRRARATDALHTPSLASRALGTEEDAALLRGRKAFKEAVCKADEVAKKAMLSVAGSRFLGSTGSFLGLNKASQVQQEETKRMSKLIEPLCSSPGYKVEKPFGDIDYDPARGYVSSETSYGGPRKSQVKMAVDTIREMLQQDYVQQKKWFLDTNPFKDRADILSKVVYRDASGKDIDIIKYEVEATMGDPAKAQEAQEVLFVLAGMTQAQFGGGKKKVHIQSEAGKRRTTKRSASRTARRSTKRSKRRAVGRSVRRSAKARRSAKRNAPMKVHKKHAA